MKVCKECHEPVVFIPLAGWCHLTITDHEVKHD